MTAEEQSKHDHQWVSNGVVILTNPEKHTQVCICGLARHKYAGKEWGDDFCSICSTVDKPHG